MRQEFNERAWNMSGKGLRKLTGLLLGIALILNCGVPSFAADTGNYKEAEPWYTSIPEMLAAGGYEEGVVVAGFIEEKKEETGSGEDPQLMEVDVDAVEADGAVGESSASEDVSIKMIRRDGMTTEEILRELAEDSRVVFAEPNYVATEQSSKAGDRLSQEDLDRIRQSLGIEADPHEKDILGSPVAPPETIVTAEDLTGLQWGNSDGASMRFSDEDVSIHVPNFGAEGSNMEGDPVVIAVFDMPIDFSHPDLKDVAYTFTPEQQEALGCDEHGFNASWSNSDGKMVYFDDCEHGTHCAGIIGASWDKHGISGVASNVKLISIQLSETDTTTSLASILRGLDFVDRANKMGVGIRITSNSWGLFQNCRAFDLAVRHLGEKYGVVTILAAGNEGVEIDQLNISAACVFDNPYVVTVASTDGFGGLSYFSCYGKQSVALGAPGSCILSTINTGNTQYIPDAVKNKYYEGFEGSPVITACQLTPEGKKADTGVDTAVCEDMGFSGDKVFRLGFNTDQSFSEDDYGKYYRFQFELGDVDSLGVVEGDHVGFAVTAPESCVVTSVQCYNAAGELLSTVMGMKEISPGNWGVNSFVIPEGADLEHFRFNLNLLFRKDISEGKVYFDSFGIGSECVAYDFLDGTSMACPAVSGAAAVIASRYPEKKGAELADLVKASVRNLPSLAGKTKTGGILDLSVSPMDPASGGPVINSISASGKRVVLKGLNFGTKQGSVTLTGETAGGRSNVIGASVVSWTDSSVSLEAETYTDYGILRAEITSSLSNKSYTMTGLIHENPSFEHGYDSFAAFGLEMSTPDFSDLETDGIIEAFGGKVYFIPKEVRVEENPAFKQFICFDFDQDRSEKVNEIPVYLENVSSAIAEGGQLFIKGTRMNTINDYPVKGYTAEIKIYRFDEKYSGWDELPTNDVYTDDVLVSDGESLYIVGREGIRQYESRVGIRKRLFTFPDDEILEANPKMAVSEDNLYLFDELNYRAWVVTRFQTVPELKELVLPRIAYEDVTSEANGLNRSMHGGALVAVSDGVMLIGPVAEDDSTDTFLLKNGETSFVPYEKRVADGKIVAAAGTTAQIRDPESGRWVERVYVIATSYTDEQKLIFRATDYRVQDTAPVPVPPEEPEKKTEHSKEWVNGKWYNKDGSQTYTGIGGWRKNKKGYWYEDTKGWYPKNIWQKIDGKWYFFDKEGYMESDAYRNGWYLGANGAWDGKKQAAGWKKDAKGWWYATSGKSYLKNCWKKINGGWYYFAASGYAAQGEFIQGWWLNAKSCCCTYPYRARWHKNSRGWWYGDGSGWYAKNGRQTIDGVKYRFDANGYYVP